MPLIRICSKILKKMKLIIKDQVIKTKISGARIQVLQSVLIQHGSQTNEFPPFLLQDVHELQVNGFDFPVLVEQLIIENLIIARLPNKPDVVVLVHFFDFGRDSVLNFNESR